MSKTCFDFVVPAGTALIPGSVYFRLYHGRRQPDQEMNEWGFAGPVFGPLSTVVMTYLRTIRLYALNGIDELWIDTHDDMAFWRGDYYGDFEIVVAGPADRA